MGLDHYLEYPEEIPADCFAAWAGNVCNAVDRLLRLLVHAPHAGDVPIITDSLVACGGNPNYTVGCSAKTAAWSSKLSGMGRSKRA